MLSRVLIANREEAAVRLVRACHDLGIEAVAVFITDREGLWVTLADRAVCVGRTCPSYLNVRNLIAAAETTGCDSVHPGWEFLAENAGFVRACGENDLVFVGPGAAAIEQMGDKSVAKRTMREPASRWCQAAPAAWPVSRSPRLAAEVGYPVLLKAAAEGGGRRRGLVAGPQELDEAFGLASAGAAASFGDGGMYLEKAVVEPRHVEMQVLADATGRVMVLGGATAPSSAGVKKLIEEAPSPALDADTRTAMADAAHRACTACGYVNAGTVEFLLDTDGAFYFIEMNTRLQVEHPVSELVTGMDRLLAAAHRGRRGAPGRGLAELSGHAIEFRLNCEDPRQDFRPAPARSPACGGRRWGRGCASTRTPTTGTGCPRSTTRCWPS